MFNRDKEKINLLRSGASQIEWQSTLIFLTCSRKIGLLAIWIASIIIMERSMRKLWNTNFFQQASKSYDYRTGWRHAPIFKLSGRFRDMNILLTFLRDSGTTKKHTPLGDRTISINTTNPIHVTKSHQLWRSFRRKDQIATRGTFEISKKTTDNS